MRIQRVPVFQMPVLHTRPRFSPLNGSILVLIPPPLPLLLGLPQIHSLDQLSPLHTDFLSLDTPHRPALPLSPLRLDPLPHQPRNRILRLPLQPAGAHFLVQIALQVPVWFLGLQPEEVQRGVGVVLVLLGFCCKREALRFVLERVLRVGDGGVVEAEFHVARAGVEVSPGEVGRDYRGLFFLCCACEGGRGVGERVVGVVRGRLFALERFELREARFAVVGGGRELLVRRHGGWLCMRCLRETGVVVSLRSQKFGGECGGPPGPHVQYLMGSNFFATPTPSSPLTRHGSVRAATSSPPMPRARVPSASLIASADALILPWLAPRALAQSPVLKRRQRRDGGNHAAQEQAAGHSRATVAADQGPCCPQWQPSPSTRSSRPWSSTGASCRTRTRTRAPAPLDLRYADIASFAHRHARSYATSADSYSQTTTSDVPQNTTIARDVASETRYSRRRSWNDGLAKQGEGLTPAQAGRRRLKYIAQAEARLNSHAARLQRDRGRYQNKLLYDGQYRSLRRFIRNLSRWDITTENLTKDSRPEADDEHWLLHAFAALDRSAYRHINALTQPVTIQHDPRCHDYVQQLLDRVERDGAERLWSNWHLLQEKQKFYETALVYMLDHKPGYAQDFVTVLAADDRLPDYKFVIIADALAHLAKLHVKGQYPSEQGWEATPDANTRKFVTAFLNCTRRIDTAVYSQDLLHSLVLLADIADLKNIYLALIRSQTRLSLGTVLHYANAFGKAGEFRHALFCLDRRLAAYDETGRQLAVDSERFRWTCATILRGSMRQAKNYHETPGIVAEFVKFGVRMDLLLYDVVMHNAMEAGDFATAFKVYNALADNGLKPDQYTFSILLHGCTIQSDPIMFRAFAELCVKKAKELENPWLATDCLYYTYICEQTKPVASRDATLVWRTYLDLFDLTPLEPFSRFGSRAMKDAIDQDALNPEKKRLAPTPMALYLVLQNEIQSIQTLSIHYLERLYKTFKHAISSNRAHPTLTSLSQTPTIWNIFLHAFGAKRQYASASAVIKDMTAHGTTPNVYSWNIFMQAFFKTGQVVAAERVFELMRARGVDPDSYTYGVMVRGYAKAQLVDRIGETMQHINEDDQLAPDLLRMLGQVQKRADLTSALEKNRLAKEKSGIEEAARKAKEEENRFESPQFKSLFQKAVTFKEPTHWDNGGVEEADDFMEPDEPATLEPKAEEKALHDPRSTNAVQTDPQFESFLGDKSAATKDDALEPGSARGSERAVESAK